MKIIGEHFNLYTGIDDKPTVQSSFSLAKLPPCYSVIIYFLLCFFLVFFHSVLRSCLR